MIRPCAIVASIAACWLCICTPSIRAQSEEPRRTESDVAIEVSQSEAFDHFATGSHWIHYTGRSGYVQLKIVVTPEGAVLTATPLSGLHWWYEEATSLARAWRYIPFQRNGKPVTASFTDHVSVVPPERRPAVSPSALPFPEIKDWDSVRISLHRTSCFGSCPSYQLTISSDGSVVYEGDAYVQYCGEYRGHIQRDVVVQLVQLFKNADYFNTFDRYAVNASDLPTSITSIAFDDKSKSVTDYGGPLVGMPEDVSAVATAIDRLAGPKVWAERTMPISDANRPCYR